MATFLENLNGLFKFIASFLVGTTLCLFYLLKAIVLFFIPKCLRFKDVSKDIVLITGGASGLGRLMAIKFAKLGSTVVVWDLNLAGLEETTKMIEEIRSKRDKTGRCYHYQVDISNRQKVYQAAERVKQEIGDVSILINNAGIVTGKRFMDCSDEQIIKTFEVNSLAHFWITKAFLPAMLEKNHGHLVSVASIAGMVGAYQLTDYCASKFAAVGLEESLRLELNCDGYDGIHSTVVCPYYIATGMFSGIGKSLIPILTPEYVVDETVKAILVNQEILCVPSIVYIILMAKAWLPTKSFLWAHRAIGAASTMKTFQGRQQTGAASHNPNNNNNNNQVPSHVILKMDNSLKNTDAHLQQEKLLAKNPPAIGITIPDIKSPSLQLNQ